MSLGKPYYSWMYSKIVCMKKMLACYYFWCPSLDETIENYVRQCDTCQIIQNLPYWVSIHPWESHQKPWFCICLDFAGPYFEKILWILTGAFSKWLDVFDMGYIKSNTLIDCLLALFCIHGIPHIIVSDIGPSFVSSEFKEFYRKNGVKHVTLVPYNLSLNSASKNAVQTFKYTMRKSF